MKEFKSFGHDTNLIMYDGNVKNIKEIQVGDILLGENSTKVKVLEKCIGCCDNMYIIIPRYGKSIITTLYTPLFCTYTPYSNDNDSYCQITLMNYFVLSAKDKYALNLVNECTHFERKKIYIDPYFLGIYLTSNIEEEKEEIEEKEGGDKNKVIYLNCNTQKTQEKVLSYLGRINIVDMEMVDGTIIKVSDEHVLNRLKYYKLVDNELFIPEIYLTNSIKVRARLLSSIIDNVGEVVLNSYVNIPMLSKNSKLISDICFLANSLGIQSTVRKFNVDVNNIQLMGRNLLNVVSEFINEFYNFDVACDFRVAKVNERLYYGIKIDNERVILSDFKLI